MDVQLTSGYRFTKKKNSIVEVPMNKLDAFTADLVIYASNICRHWRLNYCYWNNAPILSYILCFL